MKKTLHTWAIVFLLVLLIQVVFFPVEEKKESLENKDPIVINVSDDSFSENSEVFIEIENNTNKEVIIPNNCPHPPFAVYKINRTGEKNLIQTNLELNCSNKADFLIESQSSTKVSLGEWRHSLFGNTGNYQVELLLNNPEKDIKENESNNLEDKTEETATPRVFTEIFEIKQASTFYYFYNILLHQPIYNSLAFLVSIMPGYSLALAIIILTIIIRTALLIPNHKALKAQKEMQKIQPKLEAIKKKYAGQQEKIAQETMKIWTENKVNPMGGCLPLLIQLPILLALFYVIQSGFTPDNHYLLYSFLSDFSFNNLNPFFYTLDLTKPNLYLIPPILGILQFIQMKLTMGKNKASQPKEMQSASKMMMYFLPLMIVFFSATMPAGVGFYWGVSTIFGIGQQQFINTNDKPIKETNKKGKVIIDQ